MSPTAHAYAAMPCPLLPSPSSVPLPTRPASGWPAAHGAGRLLAWILATASPGSAAQSCGPSLLGNPCARGDVASQGALAPTPDLGMGNPVHLVTGNKYLFEQDVPPLPQSPLLTLARHYNSLDPRRGPLGKGWTLNYDVRLHRIGRQAHIVQADGSRVSFPLPAPDSAAQTPRGSLSRHAQGWRWLWPDGQRLDFDTQGWLVAVHAAIPRPGSLHIQRHATGLLHGQIASLIDAQGREIRLHYRLEGPYARLDSLDTPRGRWQYHYDDADGQGPRLLASEGPDGAQRRYLYDDQRQGGDPWRPTGIASAHGTAPASRLRAWHYDSSGRVIYAWQAGSLQARPPDTAGAGVTLAYAPGSRYGQPGWSQLQTANGRRLTLYTRSAQGRHALSAARLALGSGNAAAPEGWPGLRMQYDDAGRRTAWYSPLTGTQTLHYDAQGRLARVAASSGENWHYHYDHQHQLLRLTFSRAGLSQHTHLQWRQGRLLRMDHPAEQETLGHDAQGRVTERRVTRPSLPGTGQQALHYQERFEYDGQGRLITHHLPEGGLLHYRWSGKRIAGLDWQDRQGRRHIVVRSIAGHQGYRHGNGLYTRWRTHSGQTLALAVMDTHRPLWVHVRRHDIQGRVTHLADWYGWHRTGQGWRLHHDRASRLVRAAPLILPPLPPSSAQDALAPLAGTPTPRAARHEIWYAWQADGGLAAQRREGVSRKPMIERHANGLPRRVDGMSLRYGLAGRLERVVTPQGRSARYTHNGHGYRISAGYTAETDARPPTVPQTHRTSGMQYLYVGHRLAAEIDASTEQGAPSRPHGAATQPDPASGPLTAAAITRRYLYAEQGLSAFIHYGPGAPDGELYMVHTDPPGSPRLVTDAQRRVRWLAHYSPTGELLHRWGDLELAMRLPGQIADPLTGWHDNLLRTYAPALGAYLEPDPLGPVPGQQALGYARQQPQRYADPTGLILFAFDGTRQDTLTRANVWKMSQRYADGAAYYHAGPGNPYYADLDTLSAHSAFDIVTTQWLHLLDALRAAPIGVTQAIDIIGYSRGAALARHFGNWVAAHTQDGWFRYAIPGQGLLQACVDLRFMGLFDTVAQLGPLGALNRAFDLSIHPAWTRVAHAVALHEYRNWFPLSSTSGSENNNLIEAPFIGAHADIGGGLGAFTGLYIPASAGDLSDVALNWMLYQGRLAGVSWAAGPLADQQVTEPVLNDYRPGSLRWLYDGDRRVDDAFHDTLAWRQDAWDPLGAPQRQAVDAFIRRFDDWRTREGTAVGTVDMSGYAQWLQDTLGWSLP